MNFMERSAIRRAERKLGHMFVPGEHVVDFDTATYDGRAGNFRVDLIATERALYTFDSRDRDVSRMAYEEIRGIVWEPGMFEKRFGVVVHDGRALWAQLKGKPRGMAKYVKDRVQALTLLERHIDGPEGRGATFTLRPTAVSGRLGWNVSPDDGTDLDDVRTDAWVTEQIQLMKGDWDRGRSDTDLSYREYTCGWGESGTGVTFVFDADAKPTWYYSDAEHDRTATMLSDQALGEIEAAFGRTPTLQCEWPRPIWMPSFTWSPPLPGRDES